MRSSHNEDNLRSAHTQNRIIFHVCYIIYNLILTHNYSAYSRAKSTHLPKPQASIAQGGDFLIADQSDFDNSIDLYCVPISHSYCCVRNYAEIGNEN